MNGAGHPGKIENRIEHGSRATIEAEQLQKLKATLTAAYSGSRFYKKMYDQAGFDPRSVNQLKDITNVPFLTKEDVRNSYPFELLARPLDEIVRLHSSSGTSGTPTLHGLTAADIAMWSRVVTRALQYAGVQRQDILLNTHGYGLFTGGLGVHYGAEALGCTVVPTSSGRTALQVQLLIDLQATVLVGTPSYVLTIADEIERRGIDVKNDLNLRICICGAESWSENLRQDIERRLGVRALDLYGLSEVIGPGVASEHFDHQGKLIVWEDHFFPEIIDPTTGDPVTDGEEGELVLTSLSKQGAPILRYRTGDLASFADTSAETFPVSFRSLRRIETRIDGMFKVKGVSLYSAQIENILFAHPHFSGHFEIELTTKDHLDHIRVRIETRASSTSSDEIAQLLKAMTGLSMEVVISETGSIARSTGKVQRVIDHRKKR